MKAWKMAWIGLLLLSACGGADVKPEVAPNKLGINPSGIGLSYHINVQYFMQNEIGVTTSADELESSVTVFPNNGNTFYRWNDYTIRHYEKKNPDIVWGDYLLPEMTVSNRKYLPAWGFEYTMPFHADNVHIMITNPRIAGIPKTTDGFYFYLNIVDFHMWGLYTLFFTNANAYTTVYGRTNSQTNMLKLGQRLVLDMRGVDLNLLGFPSFVEDIKMDTGQIVLEYIADTEIGGRKARVIYFEQNQKFKQTIKTPFDMPFDASTRFMGHIYLDAADSSLIKAHFNEYVYGKVYAPMFVTVLTHGKRIYSVERQ